MRRPGNRWPRHRTSGVFRTMTQIETARQGIITARWNLSPAASGSSPELIRDRGGPRPDGHPGQHRCI